MEESRAEPRPGSGENKPLRRKFAIRSAAAVIVIVIAIAAGVANRTSGSGDLDEERDAIAACTETNYAAVVATASSVNGMGFQFEERLAEYADHARSAPQWVRHAYADAIEQVVNVSDTSAISSITTATCRDNYVEGG